MSKPKIMDLYNISKAGTWFVEKVCDWFFSFQWIEVKGMDIQRGGGRVKLTVQNTPQDGDGGSYSGPFAVTYSGTTATVQAGLVIVGLETSSYAGGTVTAQKKDYIYMNITATGPLTFTLAADSSIVQDNTVIKMPFAYINSDGSVAQLTGIIHYPGRFI